jgi:hypothetical protein
MAWANRLTAFASIFWVLSIVLKSERREAASTFPKAVK